MLEPLTFVCVCHSTVAFLFFFGTASGESVSQSERRKGYGGKDLQKRKVLSLKWKSEGVMDDESGELIKLMKEVPLKELGDAKLERLVRG